MEFCKSCRFLFLTLFLIGILVDVFIISSANDLVLLLLIGCWLAFVVGSRLEGRFSIVLALALLIISAHFLILQAGEVAGKIANWSYLFLVVGLIQQMVELKKKPGDLIKLDDFLRTLLKDFR